MMSLQQLPPHLAPVAPSVAPTAVILQHALRSNAGMHADRRGMGMSYGCDGGSAEEMAAKAGNWSTEEAAQKLRHHRDVCHQSMLQPQRHLRPSRLSAPALDAAAPPQTPHSASRQGALDESPSSPASRMGRAMSGSPDSLGSAPAEFAGAIPRPPRRQPGEPKRRAKAKWYRWPHIIHVDIEDLWFSGYHPEAAWYESLRFQVSLHPSSSRSPCLERPHGVPVAGRDTGCLVSSARAVSSVSPPGQTEKSGLGLRFEDKLKLRTDHLDTHLALYLWCHKASVFADEEILLGCRAVPLRDTGLHGRLAGWDVCDIQRGLEIAQVRLRCYIASVPGQIQLPHVSEVQQTSLRLNWSPPLEDRGRPVTGYRVALLAPGSEDWNIVCECNKSTSFLIDMLVTGTVYLVDIRAINEVGAGESRECEVATADTEEDLEVSGDDLAGDVEACETAAPAQSESPGN